MRTRFRNTALLALLAAPGALASTTSSAAAADPGGVSGSPVSATAPGSGPALAPLPRRGAVATWFGPGFYGKRTACGQVLTPLTLGLANRSLPCGTLVGVSYRGRSLTLPVIDRGPYANNAMWDLTGGAARALGVVDTVRIAAHVVGSARNTPSLGLPPAAAAPPSSRQPPPPAVSVIARSGGTSAG
jgi:rare lipoprotein A (peptidoglycan hydrolase)